MEILILIVALLGLLLTIIHAIIKVVNSMPTYNYKLIGTITYYTTFIWDKDGRNPITNSVALFEDSKNNSRTHEGSPVQIRQWVESWEKYHITTEQLIECLKNLGIELKRA